MFVLFHIVFHSFLFQLRFQVFSRFYFLIDALLFKRVWYHLWFLHEGFMRESLNILVYNN